MKWWEKLFDEYYPKAYAPLDASASREIDGVIRMLGLKPPKKILDLCCGYGRHLVELARKGFMVTGYDLSSYFLDRARKEAVRLKLKVKLVRGDMRKIPFKKEFDAVINLFTSFGYFQRKMWYPREGFFMLDESFFDPFTSRKETTRTLLFEDQPKREYFFSFRLYTLTEMILNLKKAGFITEQVFGDYELKDYTTQSPRMIILAKKVN
ncbi:MAG: methyltransferase domain-containing protein [candidate division Zixibacteria bacterium]|nr:methyltransferase domain-containing protein [candidate division Zixibacteria bacterium]